MKDQTAITLDQLDDWTKKEIQLINGEAEFLKIKINLYQEHKLRYGTSASMIHKLREIHNRLSGRVEQLDRLRDYFDL